MADAARPVRLTRRNVSALQVKENQMFGGQKNVLAGKRPATVRATLGEIGNKQSATLINIGEKGGALKKSVTTLKASNTTLLKDNASKENPTVEMKPKGLSVRTGTIVTGKPTARPSISTKPLAATKPTTSVSSRPSILVPSKSVFGVQNVTKSKSSVLLPSKTLTKPKPSEVKPKVEKTVEKQLETVLQINVKPDVPKVSGFSTDQLNKLQSIDFEDKHDPQSVSDYIQDIYKYMNELEAVYAVPRDYIKHCKYLNNNMRAVLIDWLVEVHKQFKLMPETLYLAVAIFDRYMPLAPDTSKHNLQLVGITCLLVASKYEEIMCPTVGDCTYITDNTYTKKQVMEMEMKILRVLDFNIGRPLPLHFLRRYTKTSEATFMHHSIAKYFMEMMLVRHEMCHVAPSLQASAALCLSIWIDNIKENPNSKIQDVWNYKLEYFSGYSFYQIEEALQSLVVIVLKGHKSTLMAVRKKYSSKNHMEISHLVEGVLPKIGTLFS